MPYICLYRSIPFDISSSRSTNFIRSQISARNLSSAKGVRNQAAPASPNKSIHFVLSVCDKRYYRVDIDTAARPSSENFLIVLKNSASESRAWLDESSFLLAICGYRPYQKAIVTISSYGSKSRSINVDLVNT